MRLFKGLKGRRNVIRFKVYKREYAGIKGNCLLLKLWDFPDMGKIK